jgi:hypothetical protein
MRVLRYWRLGLGAAVALSVSLAFAGTPGGNYPECNRKPSSADLEGAKGAHKAASQFYERGDYDKAIRYWNDAYSFDCTAHSVLINIANANEKKGDKASAIAALETYLKRSGSDPTIEEKIRNLRQSLPAGTPSTTDTTAITPPPLPTTSTTGVPTAPTPIVLQRPYGLAPWVVVGGGGASLVAGAILTPFAISTIAKTEESCGGTRVCPNKPLADQGNTARVQVGVGIAAFAVGGVMMAGGLVWQFMFNKPREIVEPLSTPRAQGSTPIRLAPAIGPGQGGLTISGTF